MNRYRRAAPSAALLAAAWVTALIAVLVAGCSQTTTGSGAPLGAGGGTPTKYSTVEELSAAVQKRYTEDKTVQLAFLSKVAQGTTVQDTTGEGAIRVDASGTAARISVGQQVGGNEERIELIALPDAVYIKLPAGQSPQPGKPWIKIDPNGSDPMSQALAPALAQLQNTTDPLSTLTRAGTTTIVGTADEPVDGVPTTRYDLRVDLSQGAADPSAGQEFKALGVTTVEPKVWVDAQDRLHKFELTVEPPGGGGKIETSARYRGWGQPVDIAAPPADQVSSLPS